jgi:predicted RNA-binding Zn-ribbon protein involved in translation (DUF1610 family)
MSHPNQKWLCPLCGEEAVWDDDNYDEFYGEVD